MFPFSLNDTIGSSYATDPDDVLRTKKGLNRLGFYAVPKEYGMTPWPDEDLFESLKSFQRDNGLAVDGIMKPGGPTQSLLERRLSGRKDERDLIPRSFAPLSGLGKGQKNRAEDVLGLRRGLAGLGFMPRGEAVSEKTLFDSPLEKAVKALQQNHGLKEDGVLRPKGPTLEALAQRLRELADDDDDDYIKPPPKPSRKPDPPVQIPPKPSRKPEPPIDIPPKPTPKPTPPQDPDKPSPDDPDKPKPDDPNKEKCRQLAGDIKNAKVAIKKFEPTLAKAQRRVEKAREKLATARQAMADSHPLSIDMNNPVKALPKLFKKLGGVVATVNSINEMKGAMARFDAAEKNLEDSEAQLAKDMKTMEGLKSKLGALEAEFSQNCGRG
ncbi:MAG: peptidoglycan-binding protein [Alphaproteobacteria bacterium]|nr:peptidoglycan-binding protein [Alphaproteobacteria bacterium]